MQYVYCIASLFLDVKYSKLEEFRSSFWMDNGKTERLIVGDATSFVYAQLVSTFTTH